MPAANEVSKPVIPMVLDGETAVDVVLLRNDVATLGVHHLNPAAIALLTVVRVGHLQGVAGRFQEVCAHWMLTVVRIHSPE